MLLNFLQILQFNAQSKKFPYFVPAINNGHDLLGVTFSTHNSTALCYHGSPGRWRWLSYSLSQERRLDFQIHVDFFSFIILLFTAKSQKSIGAIYFSWWTNLQKISICGLLSSVSCDNTQKQIDVNTSRYIVHGRWMPCIDQIVPCLLLWLAQLLLS